MAISKIILNGVTQIDLTADTVAANNLIAPNTAHGADGEPITGTASGGGSSIQTANGTVSGSGSVVLQIPCEFEPDLIYVFGDMTGNTSLRGTTTFVILKDVFMGVCADVSSSNSDEILYYMPHNITGYGTDTSVPYGTYANGVVTLNVVENSSALRFNSSVTYTYKFIKWT